MNMNGLYLSNSGSSQSQLACVAVNLHSENLYLSNCHITQHIDIVSMYMYTAGWLYISIYIGLL